MAWDCEHIIINNTPTILNFAFTSRLIAIDISSPNQKPTWYRSGYLKSIVNLDGEQFISRDLVMRFGRQLLEIPYLNYQLQFKPVPYLQNTTIRAKQLSTTEIQGVLMSASYASIPSVGADSSSTVLATTVNIALAGANASRAPEGFIVNNSNRNLWVSFTGTAATAAAPSTKVLPNGGNIDIPGSYTGTINGIWEAGATGSCVVHEFSYL